MFGVLDYPDNTFQDSIELTQCVLKSLYEFTKTTISLGLDAIEWIMLQMLPIVVGAALEDFWE